MNKELEQIAKQIRELGGDPVSLMKQALSEQVRKVRSPVMISCLSCESQEICQYKRVVTTFMQTPHSWLEEPPIFGEELYSQVATGCGGFGVIDDSIFGVR